MDKQQRYDIYKHSCGPGWWPILDRIVPQILEADPEAYLYIKEKYGLLRIEMLSNKIPIAQHIAWKYEAELASSTVCECCGRPGKLRNLSWRLTLCDDCYKKDTNGKSAAEEEAERRWLETAQ